MNGLTYAAFAAGFVVAGALSSAGGWAWNELVDNPGVVRETRRECVATATHAALEAQLAAQRRAQEEIAALTKQFDAINERRAVETAQINRELKDEIAAFQAAGHDMCAITIDNLDFLRP